MSIERTEEYITSLVKELLKQPKESEWIEFKHNNKDPQIIGEYISALSNSAALHRKTNAYVIWGIDDSSKEISGTTFKPSQTKRGGEALENWLLRLLEPKIDFNFYETTLEEKNIALLEIAPAYRHPVRFNGVEYIRFGEHKKKLKDLPEKERELWRVFDNIPFERKIAASDLDESEVLKFFEYTAYFELLDLPLPENRTGILEALKNDELITKQDNGKYSITNLGAVLFAKDLAKFNHLKRKAIRLIQYKGNTKLETIKEVQGGKGYAVGFEGLIDYINNILPSNEVIGKAFRKTIKMYPELAIRELVANAIIHQDFFQTGNSVMIEIYDNRIEITNPGEPLVDTERFLDTPPKSRNEILASFMRRINICEERGSGIDKVVAQTEVFQLPAPIFRTSNGYTVSILFAHKELKEMNKQDRVRATYLHACLKYIQNEFMTNTSLRERFGIEVKNRSMVSKIINETLDAEKIKIYDESVGTKAREYVPWWAK
ncbi:MAG: putative DNA binding domain-containing protein [Thermosipho sp. (in: Bacteria)]|nr:putative DNA binding domain-containing protein [Thermosipho sp. (in: thermotogales)]